MLAAIEALTVRYGSLVALGDVSLKIPPGAIGLLGPNGAGKSTLLKVLLGFVTPAAGRVEVLGHVLPHGALKLRARLGYMPESEAWLPGLSAVGMVTLAGELSGLDRTTAVGRSHEVLSYVGLGEARYREVATYSAGMKARVKLAQALVGDPDLLLLDEPTNGLDPQGRSEMLGLIHDISSRLGLSVLLSSHLLPDVEAVCSHAVLLDRGRLLVAAPLAELRRLRERRYDVSVRGDHAAFRQALAAAGVAMFGDGPDLTVQLEPDQGTAPVLRAAAESGVWLHRLAPRERSLSEAFVDAVRAPRQGEA